jgi:prevent-host-death family protein
VAINTINEHIPIATARDDLDAIVQRARETKRPVVITYNGDPAVVLIDAVQYQKELQERDHLRAILAGEDDIRKGRIVSHEEVEAMLDDMLAE